MSEHMHAYRPRTMASDTSSAWILTFADLLSLMLTFFVLLFSMSTVQAESWKAVVSTMSDQFNPTRPAIDPVPHETPPSLLNEKIPGLNLVYLTALLTRAINRDPLLQTAVVHREKDHVVISVPANLLFDPKTATVSEAGVRAIEQMTGTLVQIRNRLVIAGHTNQDPVGNNLFRSNWELSLTRARLVAGIMADAGYSQPVTVLGYADTRFHELDAGLGTQRRYELAERIDIVIINQKRERGTHDLF